jgi:hypothetical protein
MDRFWYSEWLASTTKMMAINCQAAKVSVGNSIRIVEGGKGLVSGGVFI